MRGLPVRDHQALPRAVIVVDHFHLVRLANQAVTKVRQRVTRQVFGRRGTTRDPAWANRRRLLRGSGETHPASSSTRCGTRSSPRRPPASCSPPGSPKKNSATCSPSPAPGRARSEISNRLFAFYDWCARADVPEVTTLAKTIEAWWPQILAFIDTGITNAGTEANNRLIKDAARIAFGFRNLDNQRRRVRLHCKRTIIS